MTRDAVVVLAEGARQLACTYRSRALLTMHVTLTPAGITYRYNFRRKTILWETVGSYTEPQDPV
jgi:hypothetical protein